MGIRKIRETDYLYASARVRAAESRLIGSDKLENAISSKGLSEIEALIASIGSGKGEKNSDRLGAYLAEAFSFVAEVSPDENIASFLRYGYDCNNIKSALKCYFRGIDCSEMLFSFGTVSATDIVRMPEEGDFSALPEHMSAAAPEAMEAYAKTKNPQLIDIILDKACYADMLDRARDSGETFALSLVQCKIDLTNIMISVRCVRMGGGYAEMDILRDSLIEGGRLKGEKLLSAARSGEGSIGEMLKGTEYSSVASLLSDDGKAALALIEKECDDLYMKRAKETRFIPFGAPLLCSYLIAVEYTVKNLRIILAGKQAGLSPESLRERVRLSYV